MTTPPSIELPAELEKVVETGTPRVATVRELLAWFDAKRRGHHVVNSIRVILEEAGIRTEPDFEDEYIDNEIRFLRTTERAEPIRSVRSIPTANRPDDLVTITRDETVAKAMTVMVHHNYSQLPVMQEDRLIGMISWRSIGRARVREDRKYVRDCLEHPEVVTVDTPLLLAIEKIAKHDFVLVKGVKEQKEKITGIITATDLSVEFHKLAEPFLLLEEIEKRIRRLLEGKFTQDELERTAEHTVDREVRGVDDLTFGQYHQLLASDEHWQRLGVDLDKKEFRRLLDEVRRIRNDIMHFSADAIEDHERNRLNGLRELLRCMM